MQNNVLKSMNVDFCCNSENVSLGGSGFVFCIDYLGQSRVEKFTKSSKIDFSMESFRGNF